MTTLGSQMRSNGTCEFCGGTGNEEYSATSKFFAKATTDGNAWPLTIFHCNQCGSRQFSLELTEEKLARLYKDYRSVRYFRQRNSFEPWYTRKVHASLDEEVEFIRRRKALLGALERSGVSNNFDCVLDHGGGAGQMISPEGEINARRRFVFDVSGVEPENGVQSVASSELAEIEWNLILSCHVLEHVISPDEYLDKLIALGHAGTWYFIEVPFENYRAAASLRSRAQKIWLEWLCKTQLPFMIVDFISTASRIKFGYIPAFGFHPLREHLQFFTVDGLKAFLSQAGLDVRLCEVGPCGHIVAVARKL